MHLSPIIITNLLITALCSLVLAIIWVAGRHARRVLHRQQQDSARQLRQSDPMFDTEFLAREQRRQREELQRDKLRRSARNETFCELFDNHDPYLCVACGAADDLAVITGFCLGCTERIRLEEQRKKSVPE